MGCGDGERWDCNFLPPSKHLNHKLWGPNFKCNIPDISFCLWSFLSASLGMAQLRLGCKNAKCWERLCFFIPAFYSSWVQSLILGCPGCQRSPNAQKHPRDAEPLWHGLEGISGNSDCLQLDATPSKKNQNSGWEFWRCFCRRGFTMTTAGFLEKIQLHWAPTMSGATCSY